MNLSDGESYTMRRIFRSDIPDKQASVIDVSHCSHRSISTNREQSLKQPSDISNTQSNSNFGYPKPDDEYGITDCECDLNQRERIKDIKPNNEHLTPCSTKYSSYRGYFFASLSGALFLFSSVIVKCVRDISPAELVMFRFFGVFVLTLPFVIYSRENPFGPQKARHLIFFSGLFFSMALFLGFIALKYLPLAVATIITLSSPALISLLAKIFLKEPCGYFQSFAVLLTLAGLMLISKVSAIVGETNSDYTTKEFFYGIGGAIGAMILMSFAYILTRKIVNVNSSVIMMNQAFIGIIGSLVLTIITDEFKIPTCGLEQWLVVLLGVFSFLAQLLLLMALKEENVGTVAILRVGMDIIFSFIWQILYFNEVPDNYSISGAILICFAILLINIKKCFPP